MSTYTHLHQAQAEAPECVALEQLKQIHVQTLKHQAQVLAEEEEVYHAHNVSLITRIAARVEQLKQTDLHACLKEEKAAAERQQHRLSTEQFVYVCEQHMMHTMHMMPDYCILMMRCIT